MLNEDARREIYVAIDRERVYQDQRHGTLADNPHGLYEWLVIMLGELAEASESLALNLDEPGARQEILQVIAVGVAALEQHGLLERKRY
jgi:hypothetical protein